MGILASPKQLDLWNIWTPTVPVIGELKLDRIHRWPMSVPRTTVPAKMALVQSTLNAFGGTFLLDKDGTLDALVFWCTCIRAWGSSLGTRVSMGESDCVDLFKIWSLLEWPCLISTEGCFNIDTWLVLWFLKKLKSSTTFPVLELLGASTVLTLLPEVSENGHFDRFLLRLSGGRSRISICRYFISTTILIPQTSWWQEHRGW